MALEGTFFDLSRCTPRSVLSPVPRKGFWRTAPWEGAHQDQRLSGTMLIVGQETRPRSITLDRSSTARTSSPWDWPSSGRWGRVRS